MEPTPSVNELTHNMEDPVAKVKKPALKMMEPTSNVKELAHKV